MIILKRPQEIAAMRESGQFVAHVLDRVEEMIQPGISTWDLEVVAESMLQKADAKAAFKGYRVGRHVFPCCLCVSINEEVVHGIPSPTRFLRDGDLVSVDFGAQINGYYGDAARTFPVGQIRPEAAELLRVAKESLDKGIEQMYASRRLQDIGAAIQLHVEAHHFHVVRDFVGHGIGRGLHEDPQVPNYGTPGKGIRLRAGMVLAIEPMVNMGTSEVEVLDDGWTVVTCDRLPSVHVEHTIAITENGPMVLTKSNLP